MGGRSADSRQPPPPAAIAALGTPAGQRVEGHLRWSSTSRGSWVAVFGADAKHITINERADSNSRSPPGERASGTTQDAPMPPAAVSGDAGVVGGLVRPPATTLRRLPLALDLAYYPGRAGTTCGRFLVHPHHDRGAEAGHGLTFGAALILECPRGGPRERHPQGLGRSRRRSAAGGIRALGRRESAASFVFSGLGCRAAGCASALGLGSLPPDATAELGVSHIFLGGGRGASASAAC